MNDAVVNEYAVEPIDQLEIFDILLFPLINLKLMLYFISIYDNCLLYFADIKDPEHPYSLEELKVITVDAVELDDGHSHARVTFTPTVEHCSMATIIGLCLHVKLMRSLPSRYKDFGQDFLVAKVNEPLKFIHKRPTAPPHSSSRDDGLPTTSSMVKAHEKMLSTTNPIISSGWNMHMLKPVFSEKRNFKALQMVDIRVAPRTHATEAAVNKQLSDKERVVPALENPNLVEMVDECLAPSYE
ncbi:hypothetical protein GIB67_005610 [Kingdonia uniflora]|uniref:MIP18 family-like domain-containing protein n=1 Tax=Kingdonia uniflora TaxID=39325 RepID=A0A7J7NIC5_9MAGN|nr:hypothetical protein GIB67_005610 [Kingdonia uniflora]